ncbi:hypothetical protein FS935_01415 [Metabacillus litoralis]|uniref:DUF3221 domain-containing protein n=1 Tax=Metabacillus litoralis TaxID=152268 RepID=A0A5C6WAG5_9BACI|nr:hypothetical protein [Metabacillus litoralis]TXC92879.1 hypothetical protein FS935_01415 [Metabacillus litoralis]
MKKTCLLIILCIITVGCSSFSDTKPVPLHPLFSNDESKYSLLVVDEDGEYDIGNEWREKNKIYNVKTVHGRSSVKEINNQYKFIEIEKSPAFVVFNTKDIVLKTYSEKELIDFLHKN